MPERLLPLPISVEDEIVLVRRARAGDEEARAELCQAYAGRIEQIVQNLLARHLPDGDPGLAEDLSQEGYVALLEFWESTECQEELYRVGATFAIRRCLEKAVLAAYSPSSMRGAYPGTKNALRFTRFLEMGYSFSQLTTAMTGIDIDEVRERKALKQRYRQHFQGWHEEEKQERAWLTAGRVLSAFVPALYLEEICYDLVGGGNPETKRGKKILGCTRVG